MLQAQPTPLRIDAALLFLQCQHFLVSTPSLHAGLTRQIRRGTQMAPQQMQRANLLIIHRASDQSWDVFKATGEASSGGLSLTDGVVTAASSSARSLEPYGPGCGSESAIEEKRMWPPLSCRLSASIAGGVPFVCSRFADCDTKYRSQTGSRQASSFGSVSSEKQDFNP